MKNALLLVTLLILLMCSFTACTERNTSTDVSSVSDYADSGTVYEKLELLTCDGTVYRTYYGSFTVASSGNAYGTDLKTGSVDVTSCGVIVSDVKQAEVDNYLNNNSVVELDARFNK